MSKHLLTKKELAEKIGCEEGQINSAGFPKRKNGKYDLNDVRKQFTEPEFIEWVHMMSRCYDPMDPDYSEYGGKGIKVCDRWHFYNNFLADIGPTPERVLS